MILRHADVAHQNVIESISFSPDGKQLLSVSWDETAKVWDCSSGNLLKTFFWPDDGCVKNACWSPDGSLVAITGSQPSSSLSENQLQSYQAWFEHKDRSYWNELEKENDSIIDDGVRIYQSELGIFEKFFPCSNAEGAVFSPDQSQLVVFSWGEVLFYNTETGKLAARFQGHPGQDKYDNDFRFAFYSKDGSQLACIDSGGVWILCTKSATLQLTATDETLFDGLPSCLPDVRQMRLERQKNQQRLSESEKARLRLRFWKELLPNFLPDHSQDQGIGLPCIAFSKNRNLAATYCESERVWYLQEKGRPSGVALFDRSLQTEKLFLESPCDKWLRTMSFSPDGKRLAAAGDHQTIFLWDTDTGKELSKIGNPPPPITKITFADCGSKLAAGNDQGQLVICETPSLRVSESIPATTSPVSHIQFFDNSKKVLSVCKNGLLTITLVSNMKPLSTFRTHEYQFKGGTILGDGEKFASVGFDQKPSHKLTNLVLKIHNITDGKELICRTFPSYWRIGSVDFSTDPAKLLITTQDNLTEVSFTNELTIHNIYSRPKAYFTKSIFLSDPSFVLVGNEGYPMQIVDTNSSEIIRTFCATRDYPASMVPSPGGKYLARSTGYSELIEMFDLETGKLKKWFLGHQAPVESLSFTNDGKLMASGSRDGTLKIWKTNEAESTEYPLASLIPLTESTNKNENWEILSNLGERDSKSE